MGRQIASVHMDIARFVFEVGKHPSDAGLANWVRSLAEGLATRDPAVNAYGALLMEEVEEFRLADKLRKKKPRQNSKDSEDSMESKDSVESLPRSEQNRTDQADQNRGEREDRSPPVDSSLDVQKRAKWTFDLYPTVAKKDGAGIRKTKEDLQRLCTLISQNPGHKWEQHAYLEAKLNAFTPLKLANWIEQQPDQTAYESLVAQAKKAGMSSWKSPDQKPVSPEESQVGAPLPAHLNGTRAGLFPIAKSPHFEAAS